MRLLEGEPGLLSKSVGGWFVWLGDTEDLASSLVTEMVQAGFARVHKETLFQHAGKTWLHFEVPRPVELGFADAARFEWEPISSAGPDSRVEDSVSESELMSSGNVIRDIAEGAVDLAKEARSRAVKTVVSVVVGVTLVGAVVYLVTRPK